MSVFGRAQLIPNTIAAFGAFFIAACIGFIMPRLVLDSVGQETLGLWDLGWSFLVYVTFSGIGYGQAIAYFSARYRTAEEDQEIDEIYATGFWCQLLFSVALMLVFVIGFSLISSHIYDLNSVHADLVEQVGLYLGATIAIVILGDVAQGTLLGLHRSRQADFVNIGHDISLAIAMVMVLGAGFGIVGLAIVTLVLRIVSEIVRFGLAARACAEFSTRTKLVSWRHAQALTLYALKSSVPAAQELIVYQTARVVLFFSAGPIALAAFSRYTTIARQINRLVDRLSVALPALTSSFHSQGDIAQIRRLFTRGTQAGLMLTLPILSVFAIFGDPLVEVWMGPEFVIHNLSSMFAAGGVLHANYSVCVRVLGGMNAHGRIALACLSGSVFILVLVCLTVFPIDALGATLLIAATMLAVVHAPYIRFACIKLDVPFLKLVQDVYIKPVVFSFGFLLVLLAAEELVARHYIWSANILVLTATGVLLMCIWHFMLEASTKLSLKALVRNQGAGLFG